MHELIQRYIAETVRYLPSKERDEVARELEANILDMVKDHPNDEEVEQTLVSMGPPYELASKYRGRERYLIGPANFDLYLMVLKLVALIVSLVTLVFTVLSFFLNPMDISVFEMIAKTIAEVFSAASAVFLWVTLTFAVLDYQHLNTKHEEWDITHLRSLEKVPTHDIKKGEVIGELVGLSIFIIFLGFLYSRSNLMAFYQKDMQPVPLFIADQLRPYVVGWIVVALLNFFVALLKLIKNRWTTPLFVTSATFDVIGVFYVILVITRWQLYNPGIFEFLSITLIRWQHIIKVVSVVLLILTLIGIAHDAYTIFWKTRHKHLQKVAKGYYDRTIGG